MKYQQNCSSNSVGPSHSAATWRQHKHEDHQLLLFFFSCFVPCHHISNNYTINCSLVETVSLCYCNRNGEMTNMLSGHRSLTFKHPYCIFLLLYSKTSLHELPNLQLKYSPSLCASHYYGHMSWTIQINVSVYQKTVFYSLKYIFGVCCIFFSV